MQIRQKGLGSYSRYEKEPIGSDSDDCKRIQQTETRAPKKKNTENSTSGAFKPSSTLQNSRIEQQFRNADFKPDYSSSRQYPFQYRSNSYPQHPNLGAKLKQQTTVSDVVNKGVGDGHVQKENSHITKDEIKSNTYNCFIEARNGNYEGKQKTREYEESDAYISMKGNLKKHLSFWKKTIRANETVCDILKNGYKLPFPYSPSNAKSKNNSSALKN